MLCIATCSVPSRRTCLYILTASYSYIPFDVLLTVHRSIFISVFNQIDAQNLFHNKLYFMPLHVSNTCAHHQDYLHYTASGIITLQVWWYQRLCNAILTSWWWAHVLETCRGMKWNLLWNKFCASSWLNTETKSYTHVNLYLHWYRTVEGSLCIDSFYMIKLKYLIIVCFAYTNKYMQFLSVFFPIILKWPLRIQLKLPPCVNV